MDISVNLDSFTLLELGALKYTEHFEHESLYLDSIDKRRRKINAKWARIAKLLARPESAAYLHPVMRHLGLIYTRPKKRRNLKLTMAQKLVKRSLKPQVLPLFRPFMCQRCSISSYSLTVIKKHECRRRKYKPYSVEELEKAATLGLRSGIRNPMCALEMTEYPNNVRLPPKIKTKTAYRLETQLQQLKNSKVPLQFQNSTIPAIKVEQNAKLNENAIPFSDGAHFANFCLQCRRSFSSMEDFKRHEGCSESKEVKFMVQNFYKFPATGFEFPSTETVNSMISMLCVNCSRTDFSNSTEFHRHIMYCS